MPNVVTQTMNIAINMFPDILIINCFLKTFINTYLTKFKLSYLRFYKKFDKILYGANFKPLLDSLLFFLCYVIF